MLLFRRCALNDSDVNIEEVLRVIQED